jgi:hypothetical protein
MVVSMLTPFARRVISRTRRLKRTKDFGAIARLTSGPSVKLNPRNFRCCGLATALFDSFTLSLSFCVMNCVMLFITRLGYCLMCGSSRSKTVTAIGKRRVPPPLLHHRLLKKSIERAYATTCSHGNSCLYSVGPRELNGDKKSARWDWTMVICTLYSVNLIMAQSHKLRRTCQERQVHKHCCKFIGISAT